MKLNGWLRLGVVLSALWLLIVLFFDPLDIGDRGTGWWLLAVLLLQIFAFWISVYAAIFAFRWVRNGFLNNRKSTPLCDAESVTDTAHATGKLAQAVPDAMSSPNNIPLPPIKPLSPSKQQIAFSTLLVVFLSLEYWLVFSLAFEGLNALSEGLFKGKGLVYFLFTGGFSFWYFWKRLNRRGWIGAIIGVIVSLGVIFSGAGIAGYVSSQPSYILEHTPIGAAIKKSYPEDYEKLIQTVVAKTKNKKMGREELDEVAVTEIALIMQGLLMKALRVTSDDALLQFGRAQVQIFQEVAALNADDCLTMMVGSDDIASYLRIMANLSQEAKDANSDASVKVINEAGLLKIASTVKDPVRLEALFINLDAKFTSTYGMSAGYFFDDSLNKPADVRCKAGLLFFKEVLNLPPDDRSFMLRELFGGE
jgi:hypothetical protein